MTSADDLKGLTADDLRKYRLSSVADAVLLLSRAELEDLSRADPCGHPLARLAEGLAGDPGADLEELSLDAARRSPLERKAIGNGRDLARRFLDASGPARAVKRLMEDVTDYAWPGEAGARHVTETGLRALQLFGYAARMPPGAVRTAEDYAHAAALVLASGDRYGAAILPLLTTASGPACRIAREDEILARLLRDPDDTALRALAGQDTFTSHLRAELHHVLTRFPPDRVRTRFADAMLRAPGWALRDIGWPHPHRALRYLDRLQATPVSASQAHAAAHAAPAAQELAERRHPGIVLTAPPRHRPIPALARRTAGPLRPLLAPTPPLPSPAGPTPRLLPNGSCRLPSRRLLPPGTQAMRHNDVHRSYQSRLTV